MKLLINVKCELLNKSTESPSAHNHLHYTIQIFVVIIIIIRNTIHRNINTPLSESVERSIISYGNVILPPNQILERNY